MPTVDDLLDMGVYTMEPYKLENDYLGRPVVVLYKAKEGAPYVLECNKWLESRAQEAMQPEKTFKKTFLWRFKAWCTIISGGTWFRCSRMR